MPDLTSEKLLEMLDQADKMSISIRKLWIESLQTLTEDGKCPACGNEGMGYRSFVVEEIGYSRYTAARIIREESDDPPASGSWMLMASTDGWDDMSEDCEASWITCEECGAALQPPDTLEWS